MFTAIFRLQALCEDTAATFELTVLAINIAPTATLTTTVAVVYDTFRLNFHHFDRFELGFREHTHVRGAAFSCLRFKLADMMLI